MSAITRALLLTDVVDSTKLSESFGDVAMAKVWAAHDRVARDLLIPHRGREIDKTDGFLLLFESATDAATYALEYHRAIAKLDPPLQARAGLHVGDVILTENSPDDVARGAKPLEVDGFAKPTGARIMALALGGQTLLSDAAREALGETPDRCELRSHGHYRLKGLTEPMELFELGVVGESPFVPPADAPKAYRVVRSGDLWNPAREIKHSLPAEHDAFVGRSEDLHALATRLDDGERLVTVLGMGGTGKTRFVRRYGWAWLGDWPGGVYFCDLSEARSLDGIVSAVAGALDVPLGKGDPVVRLGHAIAGRDRCLVILDNFEQVAAHADATLGRWLERAENASFVVTTRELLAIPGENVLPLDPLPTDGAGVELFAVRAQARKAGFALTPGNEKTVHEIVTLLDGLPLAIELAAARSAVLSPEQLLARLKDRFQILVGARGVHARQATLRAAIDWSWTLLSPWEQAALAQASVFAGGFTLEAAESVIDLSAWPEAPMSMDVVQSLVDKSLFRTWTPTQAGKRHGIDEPWFGMYVSLHEYAGEKLRTEAAIAEGASGAEAELTAQQRHGAHYAGLGRSNALAALNGPGALARGHALALELENLVAACERAVNRGDGATAVPCLRAAWSVLERKGPLAAGVALASRVFAMPLLDPTARGHARRVRCRSLLRTGRVPEAVADLEDGLAVARELGDEQGEVATLRALAIGRQQMGQVDVASEHLQAALELHRAHGNRVEEAAALDGLGSCARERGLIAEARSRYEEAREIARETGDRTEEARIISNMGIVCRLEGNPARAREAYEMALAVHRETGERRDESLVLTNLGNILRDMGEIEAATATMEQALVLARELGERFLEGAILANLGLILGVGGRLDDACRMLEAACAINHECGSPGFEAEAWSGLGTLHATAGRIDESMKAFGRAETLFAECGDDFYLAITLALRAAHQASAGATEPAREAVLKAEKLAASSGAGADSPLGRAIASARLALDGPAT